MAVTPDTIQSCYFYHCILHAAGIAYFCIALGNVVCETMAFGPGVYVSRTSAFPVTTSYPDWPRDDA